jgi:hypothetical protein
VLKAKIRDRVGDVRRRLVASSTAMAEFDEDLDLGAFRTVDASEDPVALDHVDAGGRSCLGRIGRGFSPHVASGPPDSDRRRSYARGP